MNCCEVIDTVYGAVYHALPPAPDDLVIEFSRRFIYLYEKITERSFEFPDADQPTDAGLDSNLEGIT